MLRTRSPAGATAWQRRIASQYRSSLYRTHAYILQMASHNRNHHRLPNPPFDPFLYSSMRLLRQILLLFVFLIPQMLRLLRRLLRREEE